MSISEWLDNMEDRGVDVSHIILPEHLANEDEPDETLYFNLN
ncbi:MAG: hypothetical protein WC347_08270 [Smithellaceae bacterium]|jgi:hypothetical protein